MVCLSLLPTQLYNNDAFHRRGRYFENPKVLSLNRSRPVAMLRNYCAPLRIRATIRAMAKRKNPAAVSLGRRGGKATARSLTPAQRSKMARNAARARWGKKAKG